MLEEFYAKYREHGAKEREIEALIAKHQKRLKKLQEKGGWYQQVLVPLAEALSKKLNMPYDIYGPFGLGFETSIYFFPSGKIGSIVKEDTYSITVHPSSRPHDDWRTPFEDCFCLAYNTGEKKNEYPEGTIGCLNGFNNVEAELPDNLEKILEIVKKNFVEGKKE